MPREITNHTAILEAIKSVDQIAELVDQREGHFKYELDLEVIVYGRNYTGKKVGPYARYWAYEPGEKIINQGDWGGNAFYILIEGRADVFVSNESGATTKVGEIPQGRSFGEMAVLAGLARNASVVAAEGVAVKALEIQRPAFRLLRKLPKFGHMLDVTYRDHGLKRTLEDIRQATGAAFSPELLKKLGDAARFTVYGKNHVIFQEQDPLNRVVFIKNGWVRRTRGVAFNPELSEMVLGVSEQMGVDFLGAGNCLGLEGVRGQEDWLYTATVMARTEVLEISVSYLQANPDLREAVLAEFARFSGSDDESLPRPTTDKRVVMAAGKEISTGVVDGMNLLVMDMDLCVRCGNCSLACHKIHGQSRLLRRGIHIARPVKPQSSSIQHVLMPSVCLHCQDPECLTGCPTGAIGRFAAGQIDIDPKTCIGCGDCATQCPYNAISMIPRKASAPHASLPSKLVDWLSLSEPVPPAPVTETENLLAVKCNLCNNTPLNPKGVKRQAYSCEENCPTGALVRVNPREYFSEAKNAIGIIFQDQTHAIGRNIHKRDPLALAYHIGGVILTLALTIATLWAARKYTLDARLGASSWLTVRWLTGFVGLLGIGWVMVYPARKQIYRRRRGPLRYWMLSHVYLGLIAGLVLLLHGGRSSGGLLTSSLMVTFDVVILSGLFGVVCYLVVPRILTSIEGDPLLIEDLRERREELRQTLGEISEQIASIEGADRERLRRLITRRVRRRFLSFRYLLRQYIRREELTALWAEARSEFEPIVADLAEPAARRLLIEAIETTATLRRVDALIYLHQLLKLWLAPHVVSTSLMLALLLAHIFQVVYFRAH
ncbi:MAG TPA: cyclic nucleotide-binding domain-containing protein [Pyrinomonadaceae bacterium]